MENPISSGAWYAAVLVIRSRVGGSTDAASLLDHQVRLLRAPDAEVAYELRLIREDELSHFSPGVQESAAALAEILAPRARP